jgi:hypothetical protein
MIQSLPLRSGSFPRPHPFRRPEPALSYRGASATSLRRYAALALGSKRRMDYG